MTTTFTETITRLCETVDTGDESVLPILADALEDAGIVPEIMPQGFGWRAVVQQAPDAVPGYYDDAGVPGEPGAVEHRIWRKIHEMKLPPGVWFRGVTAWTIYYRTREAACAAYALALALIEDNS